MSKGAGAVFGTLNAPSTPYHGCGITRQAASGHQDYVHLVGGVCEESLGKMSDMTITVDRFCGGALDCAKSVTMDKIEAAGQGTICTSFRPYQLRFFTDAFEDVSGEASPGNGGFLLNFWQRTC